VGNNVALVNTLTLVTTLNYSTRNSQKSDQTCTQARSSVATLLLTCYGKILDFMKKK